MRFSMFILCQCWWNHFCSDEYQFRDGIIPSFLNYSFVNLSENIFPSDISFIISLSRVAGTLLYSIDSNRNQLIVSLSNGNKPTIEFQISKQRFHFDLSTLCLCELCRFEKLKLRIQLQDKMNIQCNDGIIKSLKYERSQQVTEDYPIYKFNKTDKLEAYLWLVNTPLFEGLYPNGDQLSGCIFGVWYNTLPIKMGKHNVGDRCSITCTKDVCNDGFCLETFNIQPICNCTASFHNGLYCNSSLESRNYEVDRPVIFKTLKLSFMNINGHILRIDGHFCLNILAMEKELILRINNTDPFPITTEVVLSQQYESKNKHILILTFDESLVDVNYLQSNSSMSHIRIPYHHDLSKEIFQRLVFRSGGGLIDMVYKNTVMQLQWSSFDFNNVRHFGNATEISATIGTIPNRTYDIFSKVQIALMALLIVICLLILVLSLVKYRIGTNMRLVNSMLYKSHCLETEFRYRKDSDNFEVDGPIEGPLTLHCNLPAIVPVNYVPKVEVNEMLRRSKYTDRRTLFDDGNSFQKIDEGNEELFSRNSTASNDSLGYASTSGTTSPAPIPI